MKRKIFSSVIGVIVLTLMLSPAIGRESLGEHPKDRENELSYIFTSNLSVSTVYGQTLNVLEIYKFPIERTERENGYIETEWTDIKRGGHKLFEVKYRIRIEGNPTRITVVASTKGASSRHARNSGWWLIKKIARRTGR